VRIYKLPWMTFILVAAILIWSFQSFDQVDTIETRYLRSEHLLRILESKVKMLASICDSEGSLKKTSCETVKKISKETFQNLNQPLQKFVLALPKSISTNTEAATFQNIIFGEDFFKKNEDKLSGSEAFQQWKREQSLFDEELNEHNRASGLLSKGNWNLKTLTKAQFIHGGYAHLIGNLLFFIFLSVFVELRVGAFMYLFVFLAGGYAGLSAHLLFTSSAAITLMGASANISGIAGAFTYFFWRKNMKVFVSYAFMYNKIISIPVYFFFPALVLAGDIAGALEASSSGGGVAHLAHLGGFAIGSLSAFLIQKLDNLPPDFSFNEEFLRFHNARKLEPAQKFTEMLELLKLNPENQKTHKVILRELLVVRDWKDLNASEKQYLQNWFHYHLSSQKKNTEALLNSLEKTHPSWISKVFLKSFSGKDLQQWLNESERRELHVAAFHLIQSLFQLHPKLNSNSEWTDRFNRIESQMQRTQHEKSA